MIRTFTLLSLLGTAPLSAQITLSADLIHPAGLRLDMYALTDIGTATLPANGAAQVWDLSSITLSPAGTLDFVAASATPYAASYPAANWAWAQEIIGTGTNIVYLDISATGIEIVANNVPGATNAYSDPARIVQFPMAYGSSFVDSYLGTSSNGTPTWTYGGYGTLISPLGTFNDVAKTSSTEGEMLLWNTSPLYPLAILNDGTVLFYSLDPDASVGGEASGTQPLVYPNPVGNTLWVEVGSGTPWRILDLQGRVLDQGRTGAATATLDVQRLAAGGYLLELIGTQGTRTARFDKLAD